MVILYFYDSRLPLVLLTHDDSTVFPFLSLQLLEFVSCVQYFPRRQPFLSYLPLLSL